jgi:hypothetical protein
MRKDVEQAQCLQGACVVYSMWDGDLKEKRMKPVDAAARDRTAQVSHGGARLGE